MIPKTPTIFQMEATECGAASLAMILAYFGKHVPLEQMRIETGVSRDGCNAANIMRAAKRFGLDCHGYRKNAEYLRTVQTPCIIHWNYDHFLVYEGIKGKYAYVNDPALGRRRLTWEELCDGFSGVVLKFAKTDTFCPEKRTATVRCFIKKRFKGQEQMLAKLFLISLLLILPGIVLPLLSQRFLDDILLGGHTELAAKILLFMGCLILFKAVLTYDRSLVLQKLGSRIKLESGLEFLRHMFRLPLNFFAQRYAGDLVSRIDNYHRVNEFLTGNLTEIFFDILTAASYLIILCFFSPLMTLLGLCHTGIALLVILLSHRLLKNESIKMQIAQGELFGVLCAGFRIMDTIKASGAEDSYLSRVFACRKKYSDSEKRVGEIQNTVDGISLGMSALSKVLLLTAGGMLVFHDRMTMGMLAVFLPLYDSFHEPVMRLAGFVQKLQEMGASISRVEDISVYQEDSVFSKASAFEINRKLHGTVEVQGISFGYSALKPPMIENFSFSIGSGESIALVGSSGCGKSTAAKVLGGMYHPWDGKILLDGMWMEQIPQSILHASIAVVNQDMTLFAGTVRENLTMWNPAILESDMIEAAKDACIHEFIIEQPEGYDFVLTEDADNLSGGQRQRLEIARALAAKPTILILDEATSALDPIVEKKILDHIKRRGCTCIIAAHRLSTVRDCNQIIVMEQGKIVEMGNHKALMDRKGSYWTLVQNH